MRGVFLIINHHFNFNDLESIGIKSQLRVLEYLPICLVTSPLNNQSQFTSQYEEDLKRLGPVEHEITIEYFDQKYFNSIQGYNELLCSCTFYKRFSSYDYIIVSQPDVYLLDHKKFLNLPDLMQRYDYLGAPWINYTFNTLSLKKLEKYFILKAWANKIQWYMLHFFNFNLAKKIIPIDWIYFSGNGGFSVRKISSMIRYLESLTPDDISCIESQRQQADTRVESSIYAEDVFWSLMPQLLKKSLKIAPASVSVKYAWENGDVNRLKYYANHAEPLAIHAWMKLDLKEFVLEYEKTKKS